MKRVYVTGGNGFLGHSVVRGLAQAWDEVDYVVSADLRDPAPEHEIEGVIYARADVTDSQVISDQILDHEIDTVVHLASIVNPGKSTTT